MKNRNNNLIHSFLNSLAVIAFLYSGSIYLPTLPVTTTKTTYCLAPPNSLNINPLDKEKFIAHIKGKVGSLNPKRLTIEEARAQLISELEGLRNALQTLHEAMMEGTNLLSVGKIDEFGAEGLQKILDAAHNVEPKASAINGLPAIFGLWQEDIQNRLQEFLYTMAYDFHADKVYIRFVSNAAYDFNYSIGLTHSEHLDFYLSYRYIYLFINPSPVRPQTKEERRLAREALDRLNIASATEGIIAEDIVLTNPDADIRIFLGRSPEFVSKFGEFTDRDVVPIKAYLYSFLFTKGKRAPWMGIRNLLDINGQEGFGRFMSILRHSGGVKEVELINLVPQLQTIPEDLANIKKHNEELQRLIKFLTLYAEVVSVAVSKGTLFIDILEKGVELRPRDITPSVTERVQSYGDIVKAKGLEYILELTDQPIVIKSSDDNLLGLVLDNLIQNSIKYTPSGRVTVRLRKGWVIPMYRPRDKYAFRAILEVQDTGIGIPRNEIGKVLLDGLRASNVGQIPGSGIGLRVVQKIVRAMQGEVEIQSELHFGTEVRISFPLFEETRSPFDAVDIRNLETGL